MLKYKYIAHIIEQWESITKQSINRCRLSTTKIFSCFLQAIDMFCFAQAAVFIMQKIFIASKFLSQTLQ